MCPRVIYSTGVVTLLILDVGQGVGHEVKKRCIFGHYCNNALGARFCQITHEFRKHTVLGTTLVLIVPTGVVTLLIFDASGVILVTQNWWFMAFWNASDSDLLTTWRNIQINVSIHQQVCQTCSKQYGNATTTFKSHTSTSRSARSRHWSVPMDMVLQSFAKTRFSSYRFSCPKYAKHSRSAHLEQRFYKNIGFTNIA